MQKKALKVILNFILLLTFSTTPSYSLTTSFSHAKQIAKKIYSIHRVTFYCGCKYNGRNQVNWASCGYSPRRNQRRASRVEWEHIVPAWAFGHTRQCWREKLCTDAKGRKFKGRSCCRKIDPAFRAMEADLHNLVPAVGEINGDRNNYSFGMLGNYVSEYGRCDFVVDRNLRTVQPPEYTRGFIARTYFYMHDKYGLPISSQKMNLFKAWDKQYPPDTWEKTRAIMLIGGQYL